MDRISGVIRKFTSMLCLLNSLEQLVLIYLVLDIDAIVMLLVSVHVLLTSWY